VRGFAITLGIGIITSQFTAVYVSRSIISAWYGWRRPKTITV
jgi:preprotein translocase subunit SecD